MELPISTVYCLRLYTFVGSALYTKRYWLEDISQKQGKVLVHTCGLDTFLAPERHCQQALQWGTRDKLWFDKLPRVAENASKWF